MGIILYRIILYWFEYTYYKMKGNAMSTTGYKCTASFKGRDGLGTCDTGCQWWNGGCPCAKGSDGWDGKGE